MKIEKVMKRATITFPVRDREVCLAIKAKHIGEGCWNGYGGKIEAGETVIGSAIRELREESGVSSLQNNFERVAVVYFHNTKSDGTKSICKCEVFLIRDWIGEFMETAEMLNPTWFNVDRLPLDEMMLADRYWAPLIFRGKKLIVEAHYGPFQKTLLDPVIVTEVDMPPD